MDLNLTKVNLKDSSGTTGLSPKTLADSIYFRDGESLQFKFDNGKLLESGIFESIQAVSPTIEVYENEENISFKLKIKDVNGAIITPNLIGPKGPKGDLANTEDGTIVKTIDTYELQFVENDMQKICENHYVLRINRQQHKLGFGAKVSEVIRYIDDTTTVSVAFGYKRLVNGDVVAIFNEPFAGIIYLEGAQQE